MIEGVVPVTPEDLVFLRQWIQKGVVPMTIERGCSERLSAAGLLKREHGTVRPTPRS